jgi:peptidyl-prolyl cis-trans isomerase C
MKKSSMILSIAIGLALSCSSFAGVIATVNGKTITDDSYQALIANLPQHQKELAVKDTATRKQIIQDLIDQELMVQEAGAEKLDSTKEFKEAVDAMRKQALVNAVVARKLAPKVTNQAVRDFFERRKTKYSTDQVHAQHILLGTEKEAFEVLSEVKKAGVDFQKVAETRSKDPTAKNTRGDVGFFSRNMFDQGFTEAAFGANIGDIVGPVKTAFGFHVIKVVDRKIGKVPEFTEVEQTVRVDYQRDLLKNFVVDLRRKAKNKE